MTTILNNPKLRDNISERGFAFMEGCIDGMWHTDEDFALLQDWADNSNKIRRYPLVCFDTFIDSPKYLGIGEFIYPEIRKICNAIISGNFREVVMVAGIGGGKTTVLELLACYYAYELLCYWDAHRHFDLLSDKPITLINMGTTATQALDNAFTGIKSFILRSPFFMSHNPTILAGSIKFPKENILMLSGNSKATTPLGYNIYYAGLDEAAFYMDNDKKSVAEEIYTALQRRIVSRFKNKGLALMISSPQYDGDFVMRKLDDAKKVPDEIYSIHTPTWKLKPLTDEDIRDVFYFNSKTNGIDDIPNPALKISKIADAFNSRAEIWEIPKEYKRDFKIDPDRAKRDYAAVPGKAIDAFMPQINLIDKMFTDAESPLQLDGRYKFPDEAPLRCNYYIHIDLALNRKGKGDYAGLAMCHFEGFEEDEDLGEKRKKIVIDLAERIGAGKGGEIDFEDVRRKIYTIKGLGFPIKKVTLDMFQSVDTIQILKKKGIRAEYVSVDRSIEPYQTLKELIYGGNIKCHKMEVLLEELSRLEVTKAQKVDHPPGSSKDVADAVCGAVYTCSKESRSAMGMSSGAYYTEGQKENSKNDIGSKEAYYRQLEELNDKGLLA